MSSSAIYDCRPSDEARELTREAYDGATDLPEGGHLVHTS